MKRLRIFERQTKNRDILLIEPLELATNFQLVDHSWLINDHSCQNYVSPGELVCHFNNRSTHKFRFRFRIKNRNLLIQL